MPRPVLLVLAASALVGSTACALAAAPARPAPSRVGVDVKHQVSFRITGRELAVTLRPVDGQPNALAKSLSGTDVVVACRGTRPRTGRVATGTANAQWPQSATVLQTRLSLDVSGRTQWCLLERRDGTDIAVTFRMRVPRPVGTTEPAPTTPS